MSFSRKVSVDDCIKIMNEAQKHVRVTRIKYKDLEIDMTPSGFTSDKKKKFPFREADVISNPQAFEGMITSGNE